MRRRFKNQNINTSGYTDNTNTAYNNFNVIPSNNITMQNTSTPILGQGLDEYGNPITQPVVMQPGQDYQFGNASFVEETPLYQLGGFYNSELNWTYDVPSSYPPPPSLENNYNQPMNQNQNMLGAGQFQTSTYNVPEPTEEERRAMEQAEIERKRKEQQEEEVVPGRFQFYNPYGGYSVENASFQLGQGIESGNTLQTVGAGLKVGLGLGRNILSGLGFQRQNEQVMEEYRRQQRNALTQNNSPQYLQEGGEVASQEQQLIEGVAQALQQGVQPEEILQALVQQGLDEQTATQLIQAVMQQMQGQQPLPEQQPPMMKKGGQYLEKLKNKKIKNYTFNEKTGNYEVEVE